MNSGKKKHPPARTRVYAQILARVKPTIATPQLNKSTIRTSTAVATSASGSAFAFDLTAEEQELGPTNFQIQASTALPQPPPNVSTVPLGARTNGFANQVCPRTRVAAHAFLISRTSYLLCSVR